MKEFQTSENSYGEILALSALSIVRSLLKKNDK